MANLFNVKPFPSPYGDIFLKLTPFCAERKSQQVSVPLRGYFFEMEEPQMANLFNVKPFPSPYGDIFLKCDRLSMWRDVARLAVSVPLRGYFFEIVSARCSSREYAWFPSPYGDIF